MKKIVMIAVTGLLGLYFTGISHAKDFQESPKSDTPVEVKKTEAAKVSAEERLEEIKKKEKEMRDAEKVMQKTAQDFGQLQQKFFTDYHLDSAKFSRGQYTYDAKKDTFDLKEEAKPVEGEEKNTDS